MSSNLSCIGLGVTDEAELDFLLTHALLAATPLGRGDDGRIVVRWEDPSGARLVVGVLDGRVCDLLPSFAGSPGATLGDVRMVSDGMATASVMDDRGEQVTALALELEQRGLLLPGDALGGPASVVAMGTAVEVFENEAAFAVADASLLSPEREATPPPVEYADMGLPWPLRVGAESFMSFGVFGSPGEAAATARIAGSVLRAERRTVALTGQTFVVVRVRTVGFETDLCLAGADCAAVPSPGQVVAGVVFLVGSLETAAPSAPERDTSRLFRRRRRR